MALCGKVEGEKYLEHLTNHDACFFAFFVQRFTNNGNLKDEWKPFSVVKEEFLDEF